MKLSYNLNSYKAVRAFAAYLRSNDIDFTLRTGQRTLATVIMDVNPELWDTIDAGYQLSIKVK